MWYIGRIRLPKYEFFAGIKKGEVKVTNAFSCAMLFATREEAEKVAKELGDDWTVWG